MTYTTDALFRKYSSSTLRFLFDAVCIHTLFTYCKQCTVYVPFNFEHETPFGVDISGRSEPGNDAIVLLLLLSGPELYIDIYRYTRVQARYAF